MTQREKRDGIDKFQKAKELITAGWIRGALARDEQGVPRAIDDPMASQFCIKGALHRAECEMSLILYVSGKTNGSIAYFNDHILGTQEKAIAFLDTVISEWKKEPACD